MSKKASLKSIAHVDSKASPAPVEAGKTETGGDTPAKAKKVRKAFQPALVEALERIGKMAARQEKRMVRALKMGENVDFSILDNCFKNILLNTADAKGVSVNVPVDFALPKPKQASAAWTPTVGAAATWTEAQKATYAFLGVNQVTVMAVTGEGRRMRVTVKGGDTVMVVPRSDLQAA